MCRLLALSINLEFFIDMMKIFDLITKFEIFSSFLTMESPGGM